MLPIQLRRASSGKLSLSSNWPISIAIVLAGLSALSCTGCGTGTLSRAATIFAPNEPAILQGSIHGGQQPVSGASVYLYSFGSTGYGSAGTSMLSTSQSGVSTDGSGNGFVTTDGDGGFAITGDYSSCPASTPVYLLAAGGNPGLSAGTNNSAILLMATVGTCAQLRSTAFIMVNEVTTVVAAYALAGFANVASNTFGTSATNSLGLTNALAGIATMVNEASGQTPATATTGSGSNTGSVTIPQAKIYTLANALAACVNSADPSSSGCTNLFADTYSSATNILQAAIYVAQNPTVGLGTGNASLVNLGTSSAPFQPTLSANPTDWTFGLIYSGAGMHLPKDIAVDGSGNIWLANNITLSELSPVGAPISSSTGFTGLNINAGSGIAIDASSSTVWTSSTSNSQLIAALTSTGKAQTGSPYGGGYIGSPLGVAIDASGNVWTANSSSNNSVSKFSSAGVALSGSTSTTACTGNLNTATGIAIDPTGNAWVASRGNNSLVKFTNCNSAGGVLATGSPYTNSMNAPDHVAIDQSGQAWVTSLSGSLSGFTSSGVALTGSPFFAGGINGPYGVAIDGGNHVWAANLSGNSISEFTSTGTAISSSNAYAKGLVSGGQPHGIAIDQSGNVWVPDFNGSYLVELVGAASPTINPIALTVKNNTIGTLP